MVHCLACVDMGNDYWGRGNYVDWFMIWLAWFDVVMNVDCLHCVDNEVRHVEAVLTPCGGDMWEWKSTPCGGCTPAMWRRYGYFGNNLCVVL